MISIVKKYLSKKVKKFYPTFEFDFAGIKKSDDKQAEEIEKQKITAQIILEVRLLNQSDPDKELKEEFEDASLYDLQKYSDAKRLP